MKVPTAISTTKAVLAVAAVFGCAGLCSANPFRKADEYKRWDQIKSLPVSGRPNNIPPLFEHSCREAAGVRVWRASQEEGCEGRNRGD
jgi:hypothetical protein